MRFMIIVKATRDSEAGVMAEEKHFELEDFTPSESIERFREIGIGSKR
jgi:hypothetical protein